MKKHTGKPIILWCLITSNQKICDIQVSIYEDSTILFNKPATRSWDDEVQTM